MRFFRNVANIVMDLDGVERLNYHALGGTDDVVVNDLTGTDVDLVHVDLSALGGGGDAQPDTVTARGTEGTDRVSLSSPGAFPIVSGLSAQVLVEGSRGGERRRERRHPRRRRHDHDGHGRSTALPRYNVDGGDGDDVTRYNGTAVADTIDVVANGLEVSTVSPLASRLDTTAVENLDRARARG